jgi:hypothetical protein
MDAEKSFRENRYVYLSGAVSRDDCEKLTNHMFELFENGELEKDPQCPLSDSIYGNPIFDNLAASLAPALSKQLGVEIAPTYTYCRIYRNSELLVRHTDRPSCEISGTMTLGFDDSSGIWPIFFAEDEDDVVGHPLEINIGDIVMYRGCELPHWRPKYKGKWQVQVFFHYVNVNGPHKDHIFDGRSTMGVPKEQQPLLVEAPQREELTSKVIYNGVMITTNDEVFPGLTHFDKDFNPHLSFTAEECKKIVSHSDTLYPSKSTVGGGDKERTYDVDIRAVDTYSIELNDKTKWIFDRIAAATGTANRDYYKYNVLGITHSLQLLHYKGDENGHYDWHIDAGPGPSCTRKISVVVPLNNPQEFEGGVLDINNNGTLVTAPQAPGTMILFPSFTPHRVNPVTKGDRWSLVSWVHGTDRFK